VDIKAPIGEAAQHHYLWPCASLTDGKWLEELGQIRLTIDMARLILDSEQVRTRRMVESKIGAKLTPMVPVQHSEISDTVTVPLDSAMLPTKSSLMATQ
jgi:hypothetical protein